MSLDVNNSDLPYLLGRLFAVLERVQEEALPGVKATIRTSYWGTASTSPVQVFHLLFNLAQKHITKIKREKPGRAVNLEKLIGTIVEKLDASNPFPKTLDLLSQGRFIVGYYHQKQHPSTYSSQGE